MKNIVHPQFLFRLYSLLSDLFLSDYLFHWLFLISVYILLPQY